MGVFERMRDIGRASFNEYLERSEDPVELIDRYLTEQHALIRRTEALLDQCARHANWLRKNYQEAEELKAKRGQQAATAMKAGEEDLARLALHDKLQQEERGARYGKLYEDGKRQIDELESELAELKADFAEVSDKRQYYMARMESIRLQRRMNQMNQRFGGFSSSEPNRMFSRLEERIDEMEMENGAFRELRRAGMETILQAGSAMQSALERELANLRRKLDEEGRKES